MDLHSVLTSLVISVAFVFVMLARFESGCMRASLQADMARALICPA